MIDEKEMRSQVGRGECPSSDSIFESRQIAMKCGCCRELKTDHGFQYPLLSNFEFEITLAVILVKVSSSRTLFRRPRVGTDMAILPLTSPITHNISGNSMSVSNRVPLIFRRLHRFQQMV